MSSDQIKVALRIRPLIQREKDGQSQIHWAADNDTIFQIEPQTVSTTATSFSQKTRPAAQSGNCYAYDHVFDSTIANWCVHEESVRPIVQSAMVGYNGTIFAYGQTSSGKTYTVMGEGNDKGVIPLTIDDIFQAIESNDDREFLLRISYMEIYKEEMLDLLSGSRELKIREKRSGEVYVDNISEEFVKDPSEVYGLLEKGQERRHIGETNMNECSSRSHTIFRIVIESREKSIENADTAVLVSQLNIVDLAGSERINQTGATGERLKEGTAINQSLSTLSLVISQLTSDTKVFVHFRDSKLTRILQNSLGGNAKTAIICTVTPAAVEETRSTLNFASSAKRVQNKPIQNEVLTDEALLRRYQRKINDLTEQVEKLKSKTGITELQTQNDALNKEIEQFRDEREKLTKVILIGNVMKNENKAKSAAKNRRKTWCPGARMSESTPPTQRFRSMTDILDSSANGSFNSRPMDDILEEFSMEEQNKDNCFDSPGSVAIPRRRVRFGGMSEQRLETVFEVERSPTLETLDVGCQTESGKECQMSDESLVGVVVRDLVRQCSAESELETKNNEIARLQQQLTLSQEQFSSEKKLVETLKREMNSQQTIQKQNPSKPVIAMDPNLEQTMLDETLKLGDMSTLDAAKQTTDATENLSFGVEQKLKECYEEIARLKADNDSYRKMMEGSLMDDVRNEIIKISTSNTKLSEQSDDYKKQIEQLKTEIEQMKEAAASTPNAVADQTNLIDFDQSVSTENSKSSIQTDTDHEKLENQYNEVVKMCDQLLRENEMRAEKIKQLEIEIKLQKDQFDFWMNEKEQSFLELKSFQTHELEIIGSGQKDNTDLEEECHRLEGDLEMMKAKVAEFEGIEDYQSWKKSAEDAERLVRDLRNGLADAQTALKEEKQRYSDVKFELGKTKKDVANAKKDCDDYVWMFEQERKKHSAQLKQLQLRVAELEQNNTSENFDSVECQTEPFKNERISVLEMELEQLTELLNEGKVQLETTKEAHVSQLADFESKLEKAIQQVTEIGVERDGLTEDCENSKRHVSQMERVVSEKQYEIDTIQATVEEMTQRLNSLEKNIEEAQVLKGAEIKEYSERIEHLEKELASNLVTSDNSAILEKRLSEMELELAAKAQCTKDMEEQRDRLVEASNEQLAKMQTLVEEKETQEVGLKSSIHELNERLNVMGQSSQELEMAKAEETKRYMEQIELYEKELTKLRVTSETSAELLSKASKEQLAKIEALVEEKVTQKASFTRTIQELNEQLNAVRESSKQSHMAMVEETKRLLEQIELYEKEITELRATSETTTAELESKLSAIGRELTTKTQRVKDMEEERDQLQEASQEQLNQMESFVEEKATQDAAFQSPIQELTERLNLMGHSIQESEMAKNNNSQGSGRKRIKKIMKTSELAEETRDAKKAEKDRQKRLSQRQKEFNGIRFEEESGSIDFLSVKRVKELILDTHTHEGRDIKMEVHPSLCKILKPHQAEGIQFLYNTSFESVDRFLRGDLGGGGILAHCMGLGKTLQVIAYIHTVMSHEVFSDEIKTVLVLGPVGLLHNWHKEFQQWLDKNDEELNTINIYKFINHDSVKERVDLLNGWMRKGGVMIMSYVMYRGLLDEKSKGKEVTPVLKQTFLECLRDPGPDIVVCDEGHKLKSAETKLSKSLTQIRTRRRICLTGTPLQNNLIEYHCMVNFVRKDLLGNKKEFTNRFANPIKNGQYSNSTDDDVRIMKFRSHVLYKLLDKVVLRRDYRALSTAIPGKHEYVISVRLSERQIKLYQYFLEHVVGSTDLDSLKLRRKLLPDFHIISRICTHPYMLAQHQEDVKLKASEKSDKNNDGKAVTKRRGGAGGGDVEIIDLANTAAGCETPEDMKHWWEQSGLVREDDQFNVELSGKLTLLFEIIKMCEKIGDKILVFSQSLESLNLIESFLHYYQDCGTWFSDDHKALSGDQNWGWEKGRDYFRLDGNVGVDLRQKCQDSFNHKKNLRARLFLMSTRAGSLGINMVGANRVVIFDACWNPTHDAQSLFRVYRFGQTKHVHIYRLIAQGTMEERIYDRQVTKESLSLRVVDEQQIERHYFDRDLSELYKFNPDTLDPDANKDRPQGVVPQDQLLGDLLLDKKEFIVGHHDHEALLQHKEEETLSKEEQESAWTEYEQERKGRRTNVGHGMAGAMGNNAQMAKDDES